MTDGRPWSIELSGVLFPSAFVADFHADYFVALGEVTTPGLALSTLVVGVVRAPVDLAQDHYETKEHESADRRK